jgi:hypothetical protein
LEPPTARRLRRAKSFIFRAASLQKLDLPNLLHVQDTPNDRCTAEQASTYSANESSSPRDRNKISDRAKFLTGPLAIEGEKNSILLATMVHIVWLHPATGQTRTLTAGVSPLLAGDAVRRECCC